MVLIFSHSTTPRLQYILKLIFNQLLGIEFKVTNDESEFTAFTGAKINYSDVETPNCLRIKPHTLLFQDDIEPQEIEITHWGKHVAFFETQPHEQIPFDLFAASFYLVSRYEEYLPFMPDMHGRFEADQSLAYQKDFLRKPIINRWILKLKEILQYKYPDLKLRSTVYRYVPTIDVDMIYKYKGKGFVRNILGYWQDVYKNNAKKLLERRKVLSGKMQDPFDTYEKLRDLHIDLESRPIYFLLTANRGVYDKNIHPLNDEFISMARVFYTRAELGIHPSYQSHMSIQNLKWEIDHLSQTVDEPITKSRQHFLKMHLPTTYRNLIKQGIKEDYTMGYATKVGFRASIATPFYFYDLEKEEETELRIYPFMVMDVTLKNYLEFNQQEAEEMIDKLVRRTKKVGGTFISLWHNESLSESEDWVGWTRVYEYLVKKAR